MYTYWYYRQELDEVENYSDLYKVKEQYTTDINITEEEKRYLNKLFEIVKYELEETY